MKRQRRYIIKDAGWTHEPAGITTYGFNVGVKYVRYLFGYKVVEYYWDD